MWLLGGTLIPCNCYASHDGSTYDDLALQSGVQKSAALLDNSSRILNPLLVQAFLEPYNYQRPNEIQVLKDEYHRTKDTTNVEKWIVMSKELLQNPSLSQNIVLLTDLLEGFFILGQTEAAEVVAAKRQSLKQARRAFSIEKLRESGWSAADIEAVQDRL